MSTCTFFLTLVIATFLLSNFTFIQLMIDLSQALTVTKTKITELGAILTVHDTKFLPINSADTAALFLILLVLAAYHIIKFKRAALAAKAQVKDMTTAIQDLEKELRAAREEVNFMSNAVVALQDGVDTGIEDGDEDGEENEKEKEWRIVCSLLEEDSR